MMRTDWSDGAWTSSLNAVIYTAPSGRLGKKGDAVSPHMP
jgi:hypothetical protein